MDIILLENIPNLGNLGDRRAVKSGFARNFLVPQGKAVYANKDNIEHFEKRRAELEAKANEVLVVAKARAERLNELAIVIRSQAGDEGKLYGSIGLREIAEAVSAKGVELAKSEVLMPEGPIRNIGEYSIDVRLHSEVMAAVKVQIEVDEQA